MRNFTFLGIVALTLAITFSFTACVEPPPDDGGGGGGGAGGGGWVPYVWISPGTFLMGSLDSEVGRATGPVETQHQVTLTKGFYMSKYQVTQAQYTEVMGSNPSAYSSTGTRASYVTGLNTENFPVETVSWYDVIVFCNKLSIKENLTPAYEMMPATGDELTTNPAEWGDIPTSTDARWSAVQIVAGSTGYRLPTEAQWEYACRAGTTTVFSWGIYIDDSKANYNASNTMGAQGSYNLDEGINLERTTKVGSYAPNPWGLYDMNGNVNELCWDRAANYTSDAVTDPTGPDSGGLYRIARGGGWTNFATAMRSAYRNNSIATHTGKSNNIGFRVIRP